MRKLRIHAVISRVIEMGMLKVCIIDFLIEEEKRIMEYFHLKEVYFVSLN